MNLPVVRTLSIEHLWNSPFLLIFNDFQDWFFDKELCLFLWEMQTFLERTKRLFFNYFLLTKWVKFRIFAVNLQTSPNGLMSFEDFVIFVKVR